VPRPNLSRERRRELIPIVARAFAEFGYRRTTTAELARRCNVQENILYRLWPDKKAMFIAALGHVYEQSVGVWSELLASADDEHTAAERLLEYEAEHHGEYGQYRIVFAGLSETDDPDIRAALADMYQRYQRFIRRQIAAHRGTSAEGLPDAEMAAWAVVGLGTVANISRELGLVTDAQRQRLIGRIGRALLGDSSG
jgi:AcrR family transcriptional regulator